MENPTSMPSPAASPDDQSADRAAAPPTPAFALEGGEGEGLGDANDPSVGGALVSAEDEPPADLHR